MERPARYTIKTVPRQSREPHKERIVAARQFDTLKLIGEEVAEFEYRPVACKKTYRVVVLRKKLVVEKGTDVVEIEHDRYFFYITNDRTTPGSEIVPGQRPLRPGEPDRPVERRCEGVGDAGGQPGASNWAYMVMAGRGLEPEDMEYADLAGARSVGGEVPIGKAFAARLEFRTFPCVAMIHVPCQIVRAAGRTVYRLLSWNPWQGVFLRLVEQLHGRQLC